MLHECLQLKKNAFKVLKRQSLRPQGGLDLQVQCKINIFLQDKRVKRWRTDQSNLKLYFGGSLTALPWLLAPSREPSLCQGLAHFRWVLLLHVDLQDELDPEPETLHLQRRISGCDQKPGGSGTSDTVSKAQGLISPVRLVPSCSVFQDFLSKEGGLMYWIGLSQHNGTWTWVDNTELQDR